MEKNYCLKEIFEKFGLVEKELLFVLFRLKFDGYTSFVVDVVSLKYVPESAASDLFEEFVDHIGQILFHILSFLHNIRPTFILPNGNIVQKRHISLNKFEISHLLHDSLMINIQLA